MKWLLALAFTLALLFGCTGVPQEKYDALQEQCNAEKNTLAGQIEQKNSKVADLDAKLSDCDSQKQALNNVIEQKDSKIARLQNDSDVLMAARKKAELAGQYRTLTYYYNEAYGPGKIANTVKLQRIETQALLLNDAQMYALWKAVRDCDGITTCENAKLKFLAMIDARIAEIAFEISDIVK